MPSKVFRKAALDRLSSPEQLDQLVRITPPQGWISLGILAVLLLSALAWSWFGTISKELTGDGTLQSRGSIGDPIVQIQDCPRQAVLFLPAEQESMIVSGLEAHILPTGLSNEQYGFLIGEVQAAKLVFREGGPWMEVRITLQCDPSVPTSLRCSSSHCPHLGVSSSMPIKGTVIVPHIRPLSLLIPRLRSRGGA